MLNRNRPARRTLPIWHVVCFAILVISCSDSQNPPVAFTVVQQQDVSTANETRANLKVLIDIDSLPTKEVLKEISTHVWKAEARSWDLVMVWLYLPGMDTNFAAYTSALFSSNGLTEFKTNDYALYGTTWWSHIEDAKKGKIRQPAGAKDYLISLDVQKASSRTIDIKVNTDLPEKTNLLVNVKRIYFEMGKEAAYAGEIYSQDHPVEQGQIRLSVDVDDSIWYKERLAKKEQLQRLQMWSEIAEIRPEVTVRVLFSPMRAQPNDVLEALGTNAEFITNSNSSSIAKGAKFNSMDAEKTVLLPFKR